MGTAVVVGAGIGGLAAAIGLRRRGWDVVVLERAPGFAPVGAGLSLMANGLAALDAIGVGGDVRAVVRPYEAMRFRSRSGRSLARVPVSAEAPACGVHRATLHDLLRDALPDEVVRLGAEVTGVVGGSRPEVTYRAAGGDEVTVTADLLVGADGVRSAVRSALWPEAAPPVANGSTAWRGVTREPSMLHDAEVSWGPGTEVGLVPIEDGRVYWYVSVTEDRVPSSDLGTQRDHEAALTLVAGWYPEVAAVIAGTDADAVVRTELVHLDPAPSRYVRGAVALLGDAAHAMPPYVGQGANQALEDAAVLAAVAEPGGDVTAALAEYDRRRRPRASAVARAAVRAGRAGQMVRSPLLVGVREVAMGLAPTAVLARGLGRMVRWEAPVVPAAGAPGQR